MSRHLRYTSLPGMKDWIIPPFVDSFLETTYIFAQNSCFSTHISMDYIFSYYVDFVQNLDAGQSIRMLSTNARGCLLKYLEELITLQSSLTFDPSEKIRFPSSWMQSSSTLAKDSSDAWNIGLRMASRVRPRIPTNGLVSSPEDFFQRENAKDLSDFKPPFSREFKSQRYGHVAVACRDLPKGFIVCEYRGKLIREEDLAQRVRSLYECDSRLYPTASYAGIRKGFVWDAYWLPDGTTIDINQHYGAWLNSSDKDNAANCRLLKHPRSESVNVQPRLYIVTTKDIPRSFELVHNYNAKWWPAD